MRPLADIYSVWWADLRMLRHLWFRFLVTSLVSPALYLVAFGYGLGRGTTVEGTKYLEFVIPGIIALTAMNTSFSSAGMKLNVDRLFYRSFDEMLMAPVGSVSLVIGKSVIGVVRGLVICAIFVVIGLALSSMSITPLFVLTLLVASFLFAFMGVLAAMMTRSHQDMATFTAVLLTPMTFLGGTFFALSQVPDWLKALLYIFPLTHASLCLRAEALGKDFPWVSFAGLVLFTLFFFCLSVRAVRRASI
ncbi:MAG: ABC transporter [Chloroflexi bacterium]|nr:ABC transporter [Chloroflexota bacterium]